MRWCGSRISSPGNPAANARPAAWKRTCWPALLKKVQQGQGNDALVDQFGKVIAFNKGKGFCSLINMPGPPIESAVRLFPDEFRGD